MRISTKYKFVYISTPKVCTHSIYSVLSEHYFEGLIENGLHEVRIPAEYQSYFRWTVCRNPYTRAVSLWWSACRLHPPDIYGFRKGCGAVDDFRRFVVWLSRVRAEDREREPLMMNQTEWLESVEPITAVHVERLEEEISKLDFWKPGIVVPQLNTTTEKIETQSKEEGRSIERPPWKELYRNKEAREAILLWAGEDFIRFRYSTEVEA